jgi:hypothetical protein
VAAAERKKERERGERPPMYGDRVILGKWKEMAPINNLAQLLEKERGREWGSVSAASAKLWANELSRRPMSNGLQSAFE